MNAHVAALVALSLLLAWSVVWPRGQALDEAAFTAVNSRALPLALEVPVRLVSHLGLLPTNVLIWSVVCLVVDRRAGLVGGTGMVLAWTACRLVKAGFARTRPYLAVPGATLIGLEPSGSSFPSSHAALAVYTAVTASHLLGLGPARSTLAYVLAGVVCYARIYLGAHYPRDVLAGLVIGLAASLGAVAYGPTIDRLLALFADRG